MMVSFLEGKGKENIVFLSIVKQKNKKIVFDRNALIFVKKIVRRKHPPNIIEKKNSS